MGYLLTVHDIYKKYTVQHQGMHTAGMVTADIRTTRHLTMHGTHIHIHMNRAYRKCQQQDSITECAVGSVKFKNLMYEICIPFGRMSALLLAD